MICTGGGTVGTPCLKNQLRMLLRPMLSGKTASSGRQVGWHRGGGKFQGFLDYFGEWGGVVGTTPSVVPQLSRESCPGGQGWLTWQCPHIGLLKLHGVSVTLVTLPWCLAPPRANRHGVRPSDRSPLRLLSQFANWPWPVSCLPAQPEEDGRHGARTGELPRPEEGVPHHGGRPQERNSQGVASQEPRQRGWGGFVPTGSVREVHLGCANSYIPGCPSPSYKPS